MKKLLYYLAISLSMLILFNSCEMNDETFDESLLIGTWVSGTVHYKYNSNHEGVTWDTADDVSEAEGQRFTWTLDNADLTQIHIMEIGGNVPKYYTVDELTSTRLRYHDNFNTYTFSKK